jgi:hypothetical protein
VAFNEITNIIRYLRDFSKLSPIQLINLFDSAIFTHNSKSIIKENKKLTICKPFVPKTLKKIDADKKKLIIYIR